MTPDAIKERRPESIGFLLTDGFALMSYASVVEPFRAANILARRTLYTWHHISPDGEAVRASNGATITVDAKVGDSLPLDTIFVCTAGNPAAFNSQATLRWLRTLAQKGVRIGGVSGGPYVLARAGLLTGYRCTIHWEHVPALIEAFPDLTIDRGLYVIDRNRLTCAGGIAGLDLSVELIAQDHGRALATMVGDWYIRTQLREGGEAQRMSLRERYDIKSAKLIAALAHMETHVDEPASRAELAAIAGTSVRQLERLFATQLNTTIRDQYINIRLTRAASLLRETSMSVLDIAVACGFVSASHFSRVYKQQFGLAPKDSRRRH